MKAIAIISMLVATAVTAGSVTSAITMTAAVLMTAAEVIHQIMKEKEEK